MKASFIAKYTSSIQSRESLIDELLNTSDLLMGYELQNNTLNQASVKLGWPQWLTHETNEIYNGLPKPLNKQFGINLLTAIPVGVNLELLEFKTNINQCNRMLKLLSIYYDSYSDKCTGELKYCTAYLNLCMQEAFLKSNLPSVEYLKQVKRIKAADTLRFKLYQALVKLDANCEHTESLNQDSDESLAENEALAEHFSNDPDYLAHKQRNNRSHNVSHQAYLQANLASKASKYDTYLAYEGYEEAALVFNPMFIKNPKLSRSHQVSINYNLAKATYVKSLFTASMGWANSYFNNLVNNKQSLIEQKRDILLHTLKNMDLK